MTDIAVDCRLSDIAAPLRENPLASAMPAWQEQWVTLREIQQKQRDEIRDALAALNDRLIEALAAVPARLGLELAEVSACSEPDWAALRRAGDHLAPGTFLGDYLCVVSRLRLPAERAEALERLSTRLLGTDDVSAQAAVLLAINRADDPEPQTVRLGKLWVLDRDGLELEFVPVNYWRLDDVSDFEVYLTQIANLQRDIDVRDVRDGVIEPLIVGPKQKKDLTVQSMNSIEEPSAPSAEEVVIRAEDVVASHRAATRFLAILSVQERRVLTLAGLPPDQICADLRIRPGTLKSVRHRIREKLLKFSGTL